MFISKLFQTVESFLKHRSIWTDYWKCVHIYETRLFFAIAVSAGNVWGFVLKKTLLHLVDSTAVLKHDIIDAHISFKLFPTYKEAHTAPKEPRWISTASRKPLKAWETTRLFCKSYRQAVAQTYLAGSFAARCQIPLPLCSSRKESQMGNNYHQRGRSLGKSS